MHCEICGGEIVFIDLDGKKIPIDKHTIEDRFVEANGQWTRGRVGISHYTTCQRKKRYRLRKR